MSLRTHIPIFLWLVSIACFGGDCRAQIQEIPLHEIASKVPDTVTMAHRMPLHAAVCGPQVRHNCEREQRCWLVGGPNDGGLLRVQGSIAFHHAVPPWNP